MASAYNEGMQRSNARIKIYMHQDVFLFNRYFLVELVNTFRKRQDIGMIGVLGGVGLPQNGICYNAWNVGRVFANNSETSCCISHGDFEGVTEVEVVDGMLMATQYDIFWREDIFDKWDFYDISQSFEFRRKGYKIGVINLNNVWCMHDCGHSKLVNYYQECEKLCAEYTDFLPGISDHQGEPLMGNHELVDTVIQKSQDYFEYNLDEMRQLLDKTKRVSFRNTKLCQTLMIYEMRAEDML